MPNTFNILISLENNILTKELYSLITNEWSLPWRVIGNDHYFSNPDIADIVIFDNHSLEFKISKNSAKIYIDADSAEYNAESLLLKLRREYIVHDIRKQNKLSRYSAKPKDTFLLENTANSLNKHIEELMSQASMRRELVEQLPVGVIGVDDENIIVIANEKAIEILNLSDNFIFGTEVNKIFPEEVVSFIKDDSQEDFLIDNEVNKIRVRKSNFVLNNNFAGTILVLWDEKNNKNN